MSFIDNIFKGQFLQPKGTGGQQASLKTAQQITTDAYKNSQPVRDILSQWLKGGPAPSTGPASFLNVPDWQKSASDVYGSNANLGVTSATDAYGKAVQSNDASRLRSGITRGSTGSSTSYADLLSWYQQEKTKAQADALAKSLQVGGQLRTEQAGNFNNATNTIANPQGANQFLNLANIYGQQGQAQMAQLGDMMKAIGMLAAG